MPIVATMTSSTPPNHCPSDKQPCSGVTFRRYGKPKKRVRDVHVHSVHAQRWQCTTCGYVFRVYPQGITRRQQSLRLQALSVYFWVLGMSLGAVGDALGALGCTVKRTTVMTICGRRELQLDANCATGCAAR